MAWVGKTYMSSRYTLRTISNVSEDIRGQKASLYYSKSIAIIEPHKYSPFSKLIRPVLILENKYRCTTVSPHGTTALMTKFSHITIVNTMTENGTALYVSQMGDAPRSATFTVGSMTIESNFRDGTSSNSYSQ